MFSAVFCCPFIHLQSTGLFSVTSGKGKIRKHLSKSGLSLMSRPLEVRLKRIKGAFPPSGIGNTLQCGSEEILLSVTFLLPECLRIVGPYV